MVSCCGAVGRVMPPHTCDWQFRSRFRASALTHVCSGSYRQSPVSAECCCVMPRSKYKWLTTCQQHVAEKITSKYHHNLVMGNAVHRICIANRFAIADLLNPLNVKVAEIFHSCVAEKRLHGDWKINRSLVSVIFREI